MNKKTHINTLQPENGTFPPAKGIPKDKRKRFLPDHQFGGTFSGQTPLLINLSRHNTDGTMHRPPCPTVLFNKFVG